MGVIVLSHAVSWLQRNIIIKNYFMLHTCHIKWRESCKTKRGNCNAAYSNTEGNVEMGQVLFFIFVIR